MNHFISEKIKTNEYELFDEISQKILAENYQEALVSLKKCEKILISRKKPVRPYVILALYHNFGFCLYKLGKTNRALERFGIALSQCKQMISNSETPYETIKLLKYSSYFKLQYSEILSRDRQHLKALQNAQSSLNSIKHLFTRLSVLVSQYTFTHADKLKNSKFIEKMSKISSILDQIISKKYARKVNIYSDENWLTFFSIGSITTIQPMFLQEYIVLQPLESELEYAKILENVCILATAYFKIAAELRILSLKSSKTSEFVASKNWHERASEICNCFLPKSSPLLDFVNSSFKKHYFKKHEENSEEKRLYSKRKSEKSIKLTSNSSRRFSKQEKSNSPIDIVVTNKLFSQNLAQTLKVPIGKPPKSDRFEVRIIKDQSDSIIQNDSIILKPSLKKDLSNSSIEKCNLHSASSISDFILNSNDLYGNKSVNEDQHTTTTIIVKDKTKTKTKTKNKKKKKPHNNS